MKNKELLVPIAAVVVAIIILNFQAIVDLVAVGGPPQQNSGNLTGNMVYFEGYRMEFRAPVEESEKIQVYPDEQALRDLFLSGSVKEIRIVIISNESVNGYYILVSHSLAVDLPLIIENKTGTKPNISAMGVSSIEEAVMLSSSEAPVIMMLHPSMSDSTSVTVDGDALFLGGESFEMADRPYFDLDLAAGKLMLTLMGEYRTKE